MKKQEAHIIVSLLYSKREKQNQEETSQTFIIFTDKARTLKYPAWGIQSISISFSGEVEFKLANGTQQLKYHHHTIKNDTKSGVISSGNNIVQLQHGESLTLSSGKRKDIVIKYWVTNAAQR